MGRHVALIFKAWLTSSIWQVLTSSDFDKLKFKFWQVQRLMEKTSGNTIYQFGRHHFWTYRSWNKNSQRWQVPLMVIEEALQQPILGFNVLKVLVNKNDNTSVLISSLTNNLVNTVFSPISRHRWCKKNLSPNWKCPPFGEFFNIGLNFENKAFVYICKVYLGWLVVSRVISDYEKRGMM